MIWKSVSMMSLCLMTLAHFLKLVTITHFTHESTYTRGRARKLLIHRFPDIVNRLRWRIYSTRRLCRKVHAGRRCQQDVEDVWLGHQCWNNSSEPNLARQVCLRRSGGPSLHLRIRSPNLWLKSFTFLCLHLKHARVLFFFF